MHATRIAWNGVYFSQGNRFSVFSGKSGIFSLSSLHRAGGCRAEFGISGN